MAKGGRNRKNAAKKKPRGVIVIDKEPMYVPPGERPPYCYYPPYCRDVEATLKSWRVVNLRLQVTPATQPINVLVNGWINQLVRGQLGKFLAAAEQELHKTLQLELDADSVAVIDLALKLRAK